jgi:hypothetical protein
MYGLGNFAQINWLKKVKIYFWGAVGYVYNGILFNHDAEWNPAICDNMNGPGEHYVKWNLLGTENKYHTVLLICGI